MENPPVDFGAYMEWRKTQKGREWFRARALENHILYHCERCGDEVWMTQGTALPDELPPCPFPCGGPRIQQMAPQFWEKDDASADG